MSDGSPSTPEIIPPAGSGSATFGPTMPPANLSVHVNTNQLNIQPSNLSALERIAERNPEIASQLIKASELAVRTDGDKYKTAAGGAFVVALAILVCATVVIIKAGVLAGIVFFAACVAAMAVVTTLLTGKPQDISWTVRLLGRDQPSNDTRTDNAD